MYLKEINATGFKSFATPIDISLDNRITCIVGPNGSGKSNIVDAVRFVLGEQSVKSLRGDEGMSDVIFSGSKSRSGLNAASVTLVFDNVDNYLKIPFTEVSIKRRVYKSGENEYFLNGEKCRLKDINDLFIDSGVGKYSYNIISQGEVDKILSNSALDRRTILEEAAGVLKYKKRKEEAFRKLDRTNNNLERVNDIILELERQIEPLKEQSEQANIYLDNKNNLEKLEVALVVSDIDEINFNYHESKNKKEQLEKEILNLNVITNQKDIVNTGLHNDILKLENSLLDKRNQQIIINNEAETLNTDLALLKERSKYDGSSDDVHQNIRSLKELELTLTNKIALSDNDYQTLINNNLDKKNNINLLLAKSNELKNEKNNCLKEYNIKQKDHMEQSNRISILESSIESGGGLPNSVKQILNNPKLRGIHNTIGNLIESDEKYLKAIEVSVSASKYFVVIDNEECSKEAINYLKDNHLGRVTFFPISVIKPKGIDPDTLSIIQNNNNYIGILSDLISFDNKYRNIILNQLGNVIVVSDINAGIRLSKEINNRYKIVTLEGEIIHIGGAITGGTINVVKSIISMKQDLILEKQNSIITLEILKNLDAKINKINTELETTEQQILTLNREIVIYTDEENKILNDINSFKRELSNTTKELNDLNAVVDFSIAHEEEKLLEKVYSKDKEKGLINKEIKTLEQELLKLRNKLEDGETTNKISTNELHKLENELKELEIDISKNDIKVDNLLNVLSEDYELTYEKARDNYFLDIDRDEARKQVSSYKTIIKKMGMVNLAAVEEYKNVSSRYEFLNKQKDDLLKAKDTLFEIINEMDEVMKEEFKVTFDSINIEFKRVFKEMFKGGNAELKLTDPTNLLETGVDIIASPPGKKLTTISLLSGGEKTLTAISLLFAILNVKTVPFCLFDEVEAALDEANVDKFGHYLNHYQNKTQFLIITHKKKTMEFANTLYGMTMQESGVSKLVSVRLEEKKV